MPAHGDRRGQPRIEEPAPAGAQHAIERVHDDLERLRERLVAVALGGLAALPDPGDDRRQAVLRAREARAAEAGDRIGIVRMRQSLDQADRVDQEGADDRRIEALVVQHQHRFIEPRPRIHDKAAGAGFRRQVAEVGRDIALAVHQRHVEMREGRDRAAAAVGRQACDRGALQQERQQLGFPEDPRHQFAIAQVVARERRLVLPEHAIDGVHAVVRVVDRLAFAEQRLGHRFEAERREAPRSGTQRLDAIDDQPARRAGEIVLLRVVLAPFDFRTAAAEAQRHLEPPCMLDQHAQVELDQVPAEDRVGIVTGQPLVQLLQQLWPCRAVFQREIDIGRLLRHSAQHIDLALAAAFECNRIKLAECIGFDIKRHQP